MINNTLRVLSLTYITVCLYTKTLLFDIYHTKTDDKQYLRGINCLYTNITV